MFSLCRSLSAVFLNGCKYCFDVRKGTSSRFGSRVESRTLPSLVIFQGKTDSPLIIARERRSSKAYSPLEDVFMSNQIV